MLKPLTVQTICPVCKRPVAASYQAREDAVFFEAVCPDHGPFSALVAEQAEDYARWMKHRTVTVPPKRAITRGKRRIDVQNGAEAPFNAGVQAFGAEAPFNAGVQAFDADAGLFDTDCPLHCGTCENHLMTACCVLLDVTERCNQHCPYCFARAGEACAEDPSLKTIAGLYDRLLDLGEERTFNIQLSGGEPTVRDDLPAIVKLGRDKGFAYIQLNTNGKRIGEEPGYAAALKTAGVSAVFLQFDGTTDAIHTALRGEPLLGVKCAAIDNCRKARLPVTLVPTVVQGVNLHDIGNMVDFMLSRLDVIKGIHFQPVSYFGRHPGLPRDPRDRVTMFAVMRETERQTGGRIRCDDLAPISTGHPLCCFCGNFLREQNGELRSLIDKTQKEEGLSCCCETAPNPIEIIRRDRDFVLNKWMVGADESGRTGPDADDGGAAERDARGTPRRKRTASGAEQEPAPLSLDEALAYLRGNMFTISGMAFMDRGNLDAERLKRCRVQVFSKDERLIPFCAYNSIYRSGG
ncbi:MAG: radical SAM protein [Clostridiales Family XIII bacterium]|jgi:uncharacterized radical SAM superfamily Fe-S cluster-containing enzyme|nr:radical SAM protein [Clostridiales Family XIII bacterium]